MVREITFGDDRIVTMRKPDDDGVQIERQGTVITQYRGEHDGVDVTDE